MCIGEGNGNGGRANTERFNFAVCIDRCNRVVSDRECRRERSRLRAHVGQRIVDLRESVNLHGILGKGCRQLETVMLCEGCGIGDRSGDGRYGGIPAGEGIIERGIRRLGRFAALIGRGLPCLIVLGCEGGAVIVVPSDSQLGNGGVNSIVGLVAKLRRRSRESGNHCAAVLGPTGEGKILLFFFGLLGVRVRSNNRITVGDLFRLEDVRAVHPRDGDLCGNGVGGVAGNRSAADLGKLVGILVLSRRVGREAVTIQCKVSRARAILKGNRAIALRHSPVFITGSACWNGAAGECDGSIAGCIIDVYLCSAFQIIQIRLAIDNIITHFYRISLSGCCAEVGIRATAGSNILAIHKEFEGLTAALAEFGIDRVEFQVAVYGRSCRSCIGRRIRAIIGSRIPVLERKAIGCFDRRNIRSEDGFAVIIGLSRANVTVLIVVGYGVLRIFDKGTGDHHVGSRHREAVVRDACAAGNDLPTAEAVMRTGRCSQGNRLTGIDAGNFGGCHRTARDLIDGDGVGRLCGEVGNDRHIVTHGNKEAIAISNIVICADAGNRPT